MSLNTRRLTAKAGASAPNSPPAIMAQKIQTVNERWRQALHASSTSPANRKGTETWPVEWLRVANKPAQ
jgi:hypothetical protein